MKKFSYFFLTVIVMCCNISLVISEGKYESVQKLQTKSSTKEFLLSSSNLKILAANEVFIYEFFKQICNDQNLNQSEQFMNPILRYLEDYETSSGLILGTTVDVVQIVIAHPHLAFRMLFRFVKDLLEIQNISNQLIGQEFWDELEQEVVVIPHWPVQADLEEGVEGLLRITFIYDLELDKFANGYIKEVFTGFGLTRRHCIYIGNYARESTNYYALAVEWLELAKSLVPEKTMAGINDSELDILIISTVIKHDTEFEATKDYANTFFYRKILSGSDRKYEYKGFVWRMKQRTRDFQTWRGRPEPQYHEINFWGLCSGVGGLQTDFEKSQLHCWYETKKHPYWIINPLKIEELSQEPQVLQIYNVLSAAKCDSVIVTAEPFLIPSRVVDYKGGTMRSKTRTSFNTWLPEEDFPQSMEIAKITELITGLNVVESNASEFLQLASYNFGGHYHYHLDAINDPSERHFQVKGDRIATFMLYLSDVEIGGQTAFVNARATAQPIKGSAVFWYNLDETGSIDKNTFHGACPVILGGPKWVANKWIRYNKQFSTKRCESRISSKSELMNGLRY